ncbi:MAG TPA: riboflavin synthase [Ignavibacteria bacterium]|nr:riboflavin synthase [Ignavibacteria bacterium]
MFTGLVEGKGTLVKKIHSGEGLRLIIKAVDVMNDLGIGDSISVNGVCLTVVEKDEITFSVDTIEETLKKTNLGSLNVGDEVNLERALKVNSRLGGHFVLGHVDTTGIVTGIKEMSGSHFMTMEFPERFKKNLIYVGSIAIDGVSMTIAELNENSFSVGIIPHTWDETIFSTKKIGGTVNLEFDVLGKYVERIMTDNQKDSALT